MGPYVKKQYGDQDTMKNYIVCMMRLIWLQQLTLNLPTTTIVTPPRNVIKWQMGFNSVA